MFCKTQKNFKKQVNIGLKNNTVKEYGLWN